MPKVWQKYIKSDSLSGLWHIRETEDELRQLLTRFPEERFAHGPRNRQWLASRVLLENLLGEMGYPSGYELRKNEEGQPSLSIDGMHVSISHAADYAAVALSGAPIGVDIERMGDRIRRVAHKFMNEADMKHLDGRNDIQWMHTVWSAKEALFKFFPGNAIDFREHLHIDSVGDDWLQCRISRNGDNHPAKVPLLYFDDYVVAWAWEEAAVK